MSNMIHSHFKIHPDCRNGAHKTSEAGSPKATAFKDTVIRMYYMYDNTAQSMRVLHIVT